MGQASGIEYSGGVPDVGKFRGLLLMLLGGLLVSGCEQDWGVDQHGQLVAAEQLQGRWLLINYWA